LNCFEFIYILEPEVYKKYLKKGIYSIIPEKYLIKLKIKPKFITYFTNENGNRIGKGIGVFLTYDGLNREEYVRMVIESLNKFKEENTRKILLDNLHIINSEDIYVIEKETNMEIIDGKKVLIRFLPYVLQKIAKELNINIRDEEILIIGEDGDLTRQLIQVLSREARFLTLVGEDENYIQDLVQEIYNATGLSIFYSKNIDRILTNYSIIINLKDNQYINLNNLKSKCLIFDFSIEKILRNNLKNRYAIVVEDFLFRIPQTISEKEYFPLDNEMSSWKYEAIELFEKSHLYKLQTNGGKYDMKSFVDLQIKDKRKI